MANVSGLRVCPTCDADVSTVPKGKVCPYCSSDAIVRIAKRREFLAELNEKGFSPLIPIATQLRTRLEVISKTPMASDETQAMCNEARETAANLTEHMPGDVKYDLMLDALKLINHKLLADPVTAKNIIEVGIKIGKLCENLDNYVRLNGSK